MEVTARWPDCWSHDPLTSLPVWDRKTATSPLCSSTTRDTHPDNKSLAPSLSLSLSLPLSLFLSLSLSLVVNVNSLLFSLVTYSAFIDADIPSLRFHFNSIQPTWILSVNSWTLLLGNWPWFALEGVSQPREDMQIQHSLCMLSCKTMAKKKNNAHMDVPSWRSRTTSCYQEWQEH